MRALQLAPLLLLVILTSNAQADVLGWRVGANGWLQNYEGEMRANGDSLDLEDDLGYDDEAGFNFYASFEHPVPLFPNVLVQHTQIDSDGRGSVSGVSFDGVSLNGDVASSLDLTHTDITLYYELLDNWVNFDIGVTARLFEEGAEITDRTSGDKGSLDMDDFYPMVYAELRFDLPFSGWSVGLSGNGTEWDDDSLLDYKLNVAYEFGFGLGIEGGYRNFDFEYDDGKDYADVTIDGAYAGVYWDF